MYLITPLFFTGYILFNKAGFIVNDTQTWFSYIGFDHDHSVQFITNTATLTFVFILVMSIITLILNLSNVGMLAVHRMKGRIHGNREVGMVLCSLAIFVIQISLMLSFVS